MLPLQIKNLPLMSKPNEEMPATTNIVQFQFNACARVSVDVAETKYVYLFRRHKLTLCKRHEANSS